MLQRDRPQALKYFTRIKDPNKATCPKQATGLVMCSLYFACLVDGIFGPLEIFKVYNHTVGACRLAEIFDPDDKLQGLRLIWGMSPYWDP